MALYGNHAFSELNVGVLNFLSEGSELSIKFFHACAVLVFHLADSPNEAQISCPLNSPLLVP
jgi:hypothetical protein